VKQARAHAHECFCLAYGAKRKIIDAKKKVTELPPDYFPVASFKLPKCGAELPNALFMYVTREIYCLQLPRICLSYRFPSFVFCLDIVYFLLFISYFFPSFISSVSVFLYSDSFIPFLLNFFLPLLFNSLLSFLLSFLFFHLRLLSFNIYLFTISECLFFLVS
jgi:hypothetical protein